MVDEASIKSDSSPSALIKITGTRRGSSYFLWSNIRLALMIIGLGVGAILAGAVGRYNDFHQRLDPSEVHCALIGIFIFTAFIIVTKIVMLDVYGYAFVSGTILRRKVLLFCKQITYGKPVDLKNTVSILKDDSGMLLIVTKPWKWLGAIRDSGIFWNQSPTEVETILNQVQLIKGSVVTVKSVRRISYSRAMSLRVD